MGAQTHEYHCVSITIVGSTSGDQSALGEVLDQVRQIMEDRLAQLPDWRWAYPPVTITFASVGQLTERPFEAGEREGV